MRLEAERVFSKRMERQGDTATTSCTCDDGRECEWRFNVGCPHIGGGKHNRAGAASVVSGRSECLYLLGLCIFSCAITVGLTVAWPWL